MEFLEQILKIAQEAGASDVHLTVGSVPMMRVNGRLMEIGTEFQKLSPADTENMLDGIMTELQKGRFAEKNVCDFSFAVPGQGRYRVNAYRQRGSIAMAIRIVVFDVSFQEKTAIPEPVMNLSDCDKGLILVTGPGGSGKSTTLAALIDKINRTRNLHIITIEDPIEYLHQHQRSIVNQREIGIDSESYHAALWDAVRENPDVIMVGELNDYETLGLALTAAETGRLVLSSMNTKDVVSAIERVIGFFPVDKQPQIRIQFSNVLKAVVSQQLIPSVDEGVVAAFEVLRVGKPIKTLIREGKTSRIAAAMKEHAKEGSVSMEEALIQLFIDGKIDRDVAISYAHDSESMEMRI